MKKLMTVLATALVALTLVGCADLAGAGAGTGTKGNKTITVDATDNAEKKLDTKYRRFVKQLGNKEQVAAVKTTITIKDEDCTFTAGTENAKFGFVFGLNKSLKDGKPVEDTADEKLRDFWLFGFSTTTKMAYVEYYENVNFKDEFDTEFGTIGTAAKKAFGNGSWAAVPAGSYTYENGVWTFEIEVKQNTPNKYEVYLGGKKLCDCDGSKYYLGKDGKTKDLSIGGIAGYVNCPKGTKMVVKYETKSKDVIGSFNADEEEF